MALRRDFRETIKARAEIDPEFRHALLTEALELFLADDFDTAKSVLRNYVNAAIGFQMLAEVTEIPAQSLMRMLSAKGNPTAQNIFTIINALTCAEGIEPRVEMVPSSFADDVEDEDPPLSAACA